MFMKKNALYPETWIPAIFIFFLILLPGIADGSPNGTETIISTDTLSSNQFSPIVYDTIIAWEDERTPVSNIYIFNLTSGEEYPVLPDPNIWQTGPEIQGSRMVWGQLDMGSGSYSVIAYDLVTRSSESLPATGGPDMWSSREDHALPDISGDNIVWQDFTSAIDWDIYFYDISSGTLTPVALISNAGDQKKPAISGNFIVYENWSGSESGIWLYNITDATAFNITPETHSINPDISGNTVVWEDGGKVFRYDISTGRITQVTPPGFVTTQLNPALSDDRIVLEDYRRSSNADIYLYDISSGTEIWVSPKEENAAQTLPIISGNRIVWQDLRSGMSDIYLFTLGSADVCPVADFSPSVNAGTSPLEVTFADHSVGAPILHRIWNYSDGISSYPLNPDGETFSTPGIYPTKLTVGNMKCRNVTPAIAKYDIYVDTQPSADFTATPLAGFAPLAVQFTDSSGGGPVSWAWDFGDGSVSNEQNPLHTYTTEGQTFTVALAVNNTFAGMTPDAETKGGYIRTFLGATGTATIPIEGIIVIPRYDGWFLLYNATMLPDMVTSDPAILIASNPGTRGWQNITFISNDAIGFTDTYGNTTYMGNLSQIIFQTEDVTASGFSPAIGTGWGINYRVNTTSFPSHGSISTQIWENATIPDQARFRLIVTGSNYLLSSNGVAYTARVVKTGISGNSNATINMSLDRSWLGGEEDNTFIIGYGINSDGDTVGSVTPARYLFNDGTLDYFEAEVPEYFTTFGIAPLTGSGNPFQLITLSVTSHVSAPAPVVNPAPESDSGIPGQGAVAPAKITGTTTAPPSPPAITLPDTSRSAKVYTNPQGVITQATRLQSSDGHATISLPLGVVVKDAGGNPLEEISISVLPRESLPVVPPGAVFTFAGMAYDIGPDDATFSPPVTLTFTLPQTPGEQDYTVKSFDRKSGTWMDLPTKFDPVTGIVTVEVSHLCYFALFTQPRADSPAPAATSIPLPAASLVKAQPPSSAVSIFMNMIGWAAGQVLNNLVLLVAVIIITTAVALILEDKFPGSRR
jgi:beta propeller repeat protein